METKAEQLICDYLKAHPESTCMEVADGVGIGADRAQTLLDFLASHAIAVAVGKRECDHCLLPVYRLRVYARVNGAYLGGRA